MKGWECYDRITRDHTTEVFQMGYNVARKPIGKVTNAPIASAPSKKIHPQVLIMLVMHGGRVNI